MHIALHIMLMNHCEEIPAEFRPRRCTEMLFGVIRGTNIHGKMLLYLGNDNWHFIWNAEFWLVIWS